MKNFLSIILLIFLCHNGFGQDKIITKSKQQLNVKIIEQTNKVVKYKMNDYEDGPVIWLKTRKISIIEFKNGVTDPLGSRNPRNIRPYGLSAGGALSFTNRSGLVLVSADYFINPQIDLEFNLGSSDITTYGGYFSAGSKIHLNANNSERKLTPFTGLFFGNNYGDGFCLIPVGVNWIADSGLNASVSINEMAGFKNWFVTFGEIKVGWRFKK